MKEEEKIDEAIVPTLGPRHTIRTASSSRYIYIIFFLILPDVWMTMLGFWAFPPLPGPWRPSNLYNFGLFFGVDDGMSSFSFRFLGVDVTGPVSISPKYTSTASEKRQ